MSWFRKKRNLVCKLCDESYPEGTTFHNLIIMCADGTEELKVTACPKCTYILEKSSEILQRQEKDVGV